MGEQEQFEASIWGQSVKVAAGTIMPLLLIGLLALDAWLMHTQTQVTVKATNDAAQSTAGARSRARAHLAGRVKRGSIAAEHPSQEGYAAALSLARADVDGAERRPRR